MEMDARKVAEWMDKSKLGDLPKHAPPAQRHLAAIVTFSDDAIISKDLNGFITSWNKAAEGIFGYTAEEAIGRHITMIIPPELLQDEDRILANIRNGIPIKHFETIRITKDGRRIPLSLTISPIKDEHGTIIGASKTARDITEQKGLEQQLALMAALVASSSDAIWSMSLDGVVTSWNTSAEKLYGYVAAEMIGTLGIMIVSPGRRSEFENFREKIGLGLVVENYEMEQLTAGGEQVHVSMSMSPIYDAEQTLIGIAIIARDITERKRLEQQRNEFMGIVTHELKTPVTSLKAFGQVLQRRFARQGDEQSAGMLSRMDAQINKLTNLINDLLDVSKIEGGRLKFQMGLFTLDALVDEIVEEVQRTTEQHTITIEGSTGKTVYGDRERIGQVLTNLLTNAIKYSPHATKIVVRCASTDKDIRVCVQDFGIGIPSDQMTQLFERFYRVQGKIHATIPGLGLGLFISREIIKRQGGRIWAESVSGEGSTFCFTLPTADQPPAT